MTEKTEGNPNAPPLEQVIEVKLSELRPFKDHPFKVQDDELMQQTVDSVSQVGILTPAVVRPQPDGSYEVISGHRRMRACELAGLESMPVIVKNMTDDEAVIYMVDSNLQRETILPSERAYAYKMKLEALKHQGKRKDLTCAQNEHKLNSVKSIQLVADDAGVSRSAVQRAIRLTELIPELMNMVDNKELAQNPAIELSFLTPEEQAEVVDAMDYAQNTPSLSQAQRLKKMSREGKCSPEAMRDVLSEEKKTDLDNITLSCDELKKYFPKSYTPRKMRETIIGLLEQWNKKRQRQNER